MSNYEPPAPPPPPGGGYGAPPPAGPPGGGYGGPPPGGGYGGPPQGGPPGGGFGNQSDQWDVGSAVSYGWSKFQANTGQMILASLAIFAAFIVFALLYFLALLPASTAESSYNIETGTYTYDDGWPFLLTFVIMAVLGVLFFVFAQVIGAGLIREAIGVTEGRPFTTAGVFKFQNIGNVVVTSLLVGLGTFVGYLLCFIPGIIFAFLSMYSLFFVVDKNLKPVDAIKASIDLVKNNLGSAIVWYLVAVLIILAGELACGVGLLVAIPVALVGSAYTYKKLLGEPVAP